jgi:hypothetical protein
LTVIICLVFTYTYEVSIVRFLYSSLGFNTILCGLSLSGLAAIAAPSPLPPTIQAPASLTLRQGDGSNQTIIQGTGVEFAVPSGFQGGPPSGFDTKTITTEAAKMFPSMASFIKLLDTDPTFLRAVAVNTTKKDPEIVLITRLPVPASVPLTEIHDTMAKMLPAVLPPEFKLVEHKLDRLGTRQIVRLTVAAQVQGSKFKESIGLFREGNEVYQVTYVYADENVRQALPVFEQIVTTFKAVPTAAVTTPPI